MALDLTETVMPLSNFVILSRRPYKSFCWMYSQVLCNFPYIGLITFELSLTELIVYWYSLLTLLCRKTPLKNSFIFSF